MPRFRSDRPLVSWLTQQLARKRTTRQIAYLNREKMRANLNLMGQELTDRLAFLDAEIARLEARFR